MADRAQQALHLIGLMPIAETLADENSYGFRPKRSTHDAIEQCFLVLSRPWSPQWILEGDIKACFDKIGHEWLEKHAVLIERWQTILADMHSADTKDFAILFVAIRELFGLAAASAGESTGSGTIKKLKG